MAKNKKQKLSTRLVVYFLLIAVLPMVVIGYVSQQASQKAMQSHLFDHLLSVLDLKEQEINERVDDFAYSLGFVEKLIRDDVNKAYKAYKNGGKEYKEQCGVIENKLEQLLNNKEIFFEFFIMDVQTGEICLSTDQKQIGKIKEANFYFQEGKRDVFIQNIYYSLTLGEPAMTISIPIKDKLGNTIAVLAGRLTLDKLKNIMSQRAGLGETGETYLVNKFNFLLSGLIENDGKEDEILKKTVYSEAINNCLKHGEGAGLHENYNDNLVIGVYRWMPERDMCILAEIDQEEAFVHIRKLVNTMWVIILLAILAAFLVGVLLSRSIVRPLKKLTEGAEIIGKGDFKYKIRVKRKDELGQLADTFNKMAKDLGKIDEIKSNFISVVSHQVRTPLTSIHWITERLLKTCAGCTQHDRKYLKDIGVSVQQLSVLVDELLNVTKVEEGEISFFPQKINVTHMVQSYFDEYESLLAGKKINVSLPKESFDVVSDEMLLKNILRTLVSNAVEYTLENGSIKVSLSKKEDTFVIKIKDTGVGIREKDKAAIFDKFTRGSNAAVVKTGGIGLGLYIIKRLTELAGGKIWFESKENEGTTFFVELPLKLKEVERIK